MKHKIPLWLNEIYEKKISKIGDTYLKLDVGNFIHLHKKAHKKDHETKVAVFRDGPFLPIKTGAAASIFGMVKALQKISKKYTPILIKCIRPEDKFENYIDLPFDVLFLNQEDYYYDKYKVLDRWLRFNNIKIAHLDSAEAINIHSKSLKGLVRMVFEVHNVEHDLLRQLKASNKLIDYIKKEEARACELADLVLFRSKKNLDQFTQLNLKFSAKAKLYRGAIDVFKIKFTSSINNKAPNILFLGHLNYQPNIEALDIIYDYILPNTSRQVVVVGDISQKVINTHRDKKIRYLGRVEDLNEIFSQAYIAIAPLISGSGTRLKILDYMAGGLPVIATSLAIEGLEPEIKKYIIVEDNFKKYPAYINNISRYVTKEMLIKGRQYVIKKRTWEKTIKDIIKAYDSLKV